MLCCIWNSAIIDSLIRDLCVWRIKKKAPCYWKFGYTAILISTGIGIHTHIIRKPGLLHVNWKCSDQPGHMCTDQSMHITVWIAYICKLTCGQEGLDQPAKMPTPFIRHFCHRTAHWWSGSMTALFDKTAWLLNFLSEMRNDREMPYVSYYQRE